MPTTRYSKVKRILRDGLVLFSAAAALCSLALCLSSCVKEDRSGCPFWLTVDMSRSVRTLATKDSVEVMVYDGGGMQHSAVTFTKSLRGIGHFPVSRGDFGVLTVFGRDRGGYSYDRRRITFARGCEADSLWTSRLDSTFYGDVLTVYPVLHKQWCKVTFIGEQEDGGGYVPSETFVLDKPSSGNFFDTYRISVRGTAAGFDMATLEGVPGEFFFEPPVQRDSTSVNLPRQEGGGLYVDITNNITGVMEYTISLTTAMKAVGYDWTEDDLRDVRLTISMIADCLYEIRIKEWEPVDMGDIEI